MEKRYIFNKLVRDDAVSIMDKYCSDIVYSKVTDKSLGKKLFNEKFLEEVEEVFDAKSPDELAIELADLIEVIYGYAKFMGIDKQVIEEKRIAKNKERGPFQQSYYVESVKLDEKHPMALYFQQTPDKYPESE